MASLIPPRGMVIDSQYSPVVGLLRGGQYNAVTRDTDSGRKAVFELLRGLHWKS
jgi:hypothetical protein